MTVVQIADVTNAAIETPFTEEVLIVDKPATPTEACRLRFQTTDWHGNAIVLLPGLFQPNQNGSMSKNR